MFLTLCKRTCHFSLAVVLSGLALAQNDRGIITGTVQDQAHAMVAGAAVAARNVATGAVYETRATDTGNFTLPSLPPGSYEITVSAPGFSKFIGRGTDVQVAQVVRVDVSLQVGAVTESVTVDASAPLLKTESAEQSLNITKEQITKLPLIGTGGVRNPRAFIILSPGVSGTSGTGGRVNGQTANTTRLYIDGQDTSNANNNGTNTGPPPQEMIQEYSLLTSNFSAEYGQVQGGAVVMATRSGTNSFRGSLFEYAQNDALDASKPFVQTKALNRKNDFGGTLSGPVYIPRIYNGRNKTFFFFSFEEAKNSISMAGSLNTVPTSAYRQGDFSGALTGRVLTGRDPLGNALLENAIYDPLSNQTIGGVVTRTVFPGNIIPTNRLDPVALKIQALIPLPQTSGNLNNWSQAPRFKTWSVTPALKIDHSLTDKMRLSFYLHRPSNLAPNNIDGLPLPISAIQNTIGVNWISRLNFDYTLAPTVLLHLGVGLFRLYSPASSPQQVLDYDAAGQLGFTGSSTGTGFPRITGLNSATGGGMGPAIGPAGADLQNYQKITAPASISYVRGNHTYKLGGEFRLESFADNNLGGTYGVLNFSATESGQPSTQGQNLGGGSVGFPYASFLLGAANNGTVQSPQNLMWRNSRWGLYLQDTWKVTRKFTLDYGIRWDLQDQGHEIWNRNSMFGPSTPNPSAGGRLGGVVYEGYGQGRCNCKFTETYPYAVGPRLGFAYQINSKTVIRGGWGVVYASLATFNSFTTSPVIGVGINQLAFAAPSFGAPAITLRNGLVYNKADLYTASLDPGLRPTPGTVTSPNYYIDPNANRPGRINTFSINVQREITKSFMLEAAYVANRGVWLIGATSLVNQNAISDARLASVNLNRTLAADQQLLTSTVGSPLAASRGFGLPYAGFPASQTVAQSLRPYPQFNSAFNPMWAPLGNNWYDSLQMKGTHRFSHGLSATGAFTWSKELATGQGVNDAFNRVNQKSLVGSSQPLLFVTAFTYEIPSDLYGLTKNKIVKQIVGKWSIGGLVRYGSGVPIAVPASTGNLNSLVFQSTRMNRVPDVPLYLKDLNCHCIDPTKDLVLNKAAWAEVPNGQWGTSAPYYNDYRQARTPSEQLSLSRLFQVGERYSLEVRGEFFNVFNRIVMPTPSSGNPLISTTTNAQGLLTGGFGFINASNVGTPRIGQIVLRLQF